MKRKIITVEPISSIANLRFDADMDKLHSCYVDNEENGNLFLSSINGKYKFSMSKKKDPNWIIVK